jgi:hypothetical protein
MPHARSPLSAPGSVEQPLPNKVFYYYLPYINQNGAFKPPKAIVCTNIGAQAGISKGS